MKKKIIIPVVICLIVVIGVIGFIIWNNNKIVSTIMMDINPSIEINLDRSDKVINLLALNDDAKEIISNDIKGKSLEDTFEILITNLVEKGYANKEDELNVVLHVDGKITNKKVSEKIEFEFGKNEIHTEIITIDNVTKEDEKLAKKYNVSPAKIAYIKTIIKDNDSINVEDLANKSVSELNETKTTGKYCENGYTLEGDWCIKELNRTQALQGNICPDGYTEYKGKCYEEVKSIETNNYVCNSEFKLIDNDCVLEDTYDATGKCDSGDYDNGYCVIKEYIGQAKEYCRITPETDLLYNGRCLGRKPTINGGCINGDKLIGGYCYDTSSNSGYKADWICPDGTPMSNPDGTLINEDKKCYKETKTKATSYYCNGNDKLDGIKCKTKVIEKVQKEKTCPSGYTPIDDGSRCINLNNIKPKESGLVCEGENVERLGDICVIYEKVEAK